MAALVDELDAHMSDSCGGFGGADEALAQRLLAALGRLGPRGESGGRRLGGLTVTLSGQRGSLSGRAASERRRGGLTVALSGWLPLRAKIIFSQDLKAHI